MEDLFATPVPTISALAIKLDVLAADLRDFEPNEACRSPTSSPTPIASRRGRVEPCKLIFHDAPSSAAADLPLWLLLLCPQRLGLTCRTSNVTGRSERRAYREFEADARRVLR